MARARGKRAEIITQETALGRLHGDAGTGNRRAAFPPGGRADGGTDGRLLEETYGDKPATTALSGLLPGMVKGLTGKTVGSRVLLVVPPDQGYPDGNDKPKIEKGETLGFMKVVANAETGKILGAAILGTGGDEAIHGILDAINAGTQYRDLQWAVPIHPTVSELIPTVIDAMQ
jgi:hypothetical protein